MGTSLTLSVFSLFIFSAASLAQELAHTGRPLWQFFDTRHTGGAPVTHQGYLDSNGILYAANDAGLLSFDGVRWNLNKIGSDSRPIQTLYPLDEHSFLLGGPNTLGIVSPTKNGDLEWHDLISQTGNENIQAYEAVLNISTFNNRVLITTDRSVLELAENTFSELIAAEPTGLTFTLNDHLFVEVDNRFVQISDRVPSDVALPPGWDDLEPITVLFDQDEEPLLVTRRAGLFRLTIDDNKVRLSPLWTELPAPLDTTSISAATRLSDGSFIMGSESGELVHLSIDGVSRLSIDRRSGFRAGRTRAITPMTDGSVMVFYDGGAVWLNMSDNVRVWDKENGLTAPVTDATDEGASIFIGTPEGVFKTAPGHRAIPVPEVGSEPVVTLNKFARSTIRGHTSLLIGRTDGLYDFFDNRLEQITSIPPNAVHVSTSQPTRVAIATDVGILLMDFDGGTWIESGILGTPDTLPALTLAESPDGRLLSVFADGSIRTYATDQWLSDTIDLETQPLHTQNLARRMPPSFHPFFSTGDDTVFLFMPGPPLRLDPRSEIFVTDVDLSRQLRSVPPRWISAGQTRDTFWLQTQTGLYGLNKQAEEQSHNLISPYTAGTYASGMVLVDPPNGRVLVGTPNGLSEAPLHTKSDTNRSHSRPPLLIRMASVNGTKIFGGHGLMPPLNLASSQDIIQFKLSVLKWGLRCASLSVALTSTTETSAPQLWSLNERCQTAIAHDWLSNPSETYQLSLMSESIQISEPARFNVEVQRPWFRSAVLPLIAAFLMGLVAVSGKVIRRRPWPEPIVRVLSLYAGLLLAWSAALASGISQAGLSAGLVTTQLLGLGCVALILPAGVQILMGLRDISPNVRP